MPLEPLTPQNTTIIAVDFAVGFANLLRSHDLAGHVNNVVGLAKTATFFRSGLVVTNGLPSKPSGPLYPQSWAHCGPATRPTSSSTRAPA
jgi:hypothetical protein